MYINEATNELVKKGDIRLGKVKVEKHISVDPMCQEGKVSSDKIVIMSDDLSTSEIATINYIGEEEDIEFIGKILKDAPFGAC